MCDRSQQTYEDVALRVRRHTAERRDHNRFIALVEQSAGIMRADAERAVEATRATCSAIRCARS